MDLSTEEIKLLVKCYICQNVRDTGYSFRSLEENEKLIHQSLENKNLITQSYWKALSSSFSIYKTTEMGSKIAHEKIIGILEDINIGEEICKIPLLFLKLLFFHSNIYNHPVEMDFKDFYWEDSLLEFIRENGLEYWNSLHEIFKNFGILETPTSYVSTNRGEHRDQYITLPEREIIQFLDTKLGVKEGLSEDIVKKLTKERHEILKKRQRLFFEGIIEDYAPKYAKLTQKKLDPEYSAEKRKSITIFFSYSTVDAKKYKIAEIADHLKKYKDVEDILYWEKSAGSNIIEYMNDNLGNMDILVLFCSPDALKSNSVLTEWTVAEHEKKPIIPIFTKLEHIPTLLKPRQGIEFNMFEFEDFISNLHSLAVKLTD